MSQGILQSKSSIIYMFLILKVKGGGGGGVFLLGFKRILIFLVDTDFPFPLISPSKHDFCFTVLLPI